ncbi:flavoprotein [Kineosporia sp. NBRC 101731]|uniref:flavoprotein n=1 Tax=Kineosporia sp. NBRC 101731 TaxID=3032199 RepID=UPI00332018D3
MPRGLRERSPHLRIGCFVVAPTSSNFVTKLSTGVADNQALTQVSETLGTSTPIVLFPRVNAAHIRHPAREEKHRPAAPYRRPPHRGRFSAIALSMRRSTTPSCASKTIATGAVTSWRCSYAGIELTPPELLPEHSWKRRHLLTSKINRHVPPACTFQSESVEALFIFH